MSEGIGEAGKSWDDYWKDAKKANGPYAIVAHFYRRFLIAPLLRHYFLKYFSDDSGCRYLHAGCGSAESDSLIPFTKSTFYLMDLSEEALVLAKRRVTTTPSVYVQGDVMKLPFEPDYFDGIWNLGVMEHFEEQELRAIFREFRRVLKPGGTCLMFWPPEFGLSVMALGATHFVLNRIFRLKVSLHAAEPTKFKSKAWLDSLLKDEGLAIKEATFGPRDAWTYVRLCLVRVEKKPHCHEQGCGQEGS